ncbi:hypothetical protein PT974_09938 [Cladobotryum mycophilum]|uniref:Amidoligase enzyme n=1 Tax=Cladobotryum mycophilum TaxID=491253 RepID=A0ABR0S9J9_9HYPO
MSRTEITFGLELEFMMDAGKEVLDASTNPMPRRVIAENLVKLAPGLPVSAQCTHRTPGACAICKDAPRELRAQNIRVFAPNKPIFPPARTLHVPWNPDTGGVTCYSLELSTPIFDSAELKAGVPRLAKVVSALRGMKHRLTANTQCGLHIHVGPGGGGMKLDVAKKVVTLTYLLERPLLSALCHPKRKQAAFYKPLYMRSAGMRTARMRREQKRPLTAECKELLEHFPYTLQTLKPGGWNMKQPADLLEVLRMLWDAKTLPQLWGGIVDSSEHKGSLAIVFRDQEGNPAKEMKPKAANYEDKPSTFEFRYPQMGFDTIFVRNWAEIVCRIVEIGTLEKGSFKAKVTEIVATLEACEGKDTIGPMLQCLGLKNQIPQWSEQLQRYDAGYAIPGLGKDGWVVPEK